MTCWLLGPTMCLESSNKINVCVIRCFMVTDGEVSFQVRVRPSVVDATDYYMSMDYSYSMRNDVAVIRTLTSSIGMYFRLLLSLSVFVLLWLVQTLTSTNNQIGFGVYVDKPLTPFIHVDPEQWVYDVCTL